MKEDAVLRQILNSTAALRVAEPSVERPDPDETSAMLGGYATKAPGPAPDDVRAAGSADARAASPVRAPGAPTINGDPGRAVDPPQDGLTLRQFLGSLATRQRKQAGEPTTDGATAITDEGEYLADDNDDEVGFSLGDRLLDSRMLAEALQGFVERNIDGSLETSFSIFGQGRFVLDVSDNLGSIGLSERSTGISATLVARGDERRPGPEPEQKIDVVLLVLDFLSTPTGTLVTIVGGLLLGLWGMARCIGALRR